MQKTFYGWWVTLATFFTFGLAVGIPYYGGPFFYDYYMQTFGWTRADITLGFPIAATFTLGVGPLLVHRFSPRRLILVGTAMTGLAFVGFGTMGGGLGLYYGLWFLYIIGYIFSGPIPHQVIISQWFRKHRGKAMAIAYLGVGVFGGLSAKFVAKPLTDLFGFQGALIAIGSLMLLVWPITLFVLRDRPADMGLMPDGESSATALPPAAPRDFRYLLRQRAFWLLALGSFASIGAIGSVNQHMKLVFLEQGYTDQDQLDTVFGNATMMILWSSIGGRLFMGWAADRFPKKYVMSITYALVAGTIPLLLTVHPGSEISLYVFAVLFGFGMGADYMLIPLMAAEHFGVNTLARSMAIILPTDTIGQTWFPYLVSILHGAVGGYKYAMLAVFGLAALGALAIVMLPKHGQKDESVSSAEPQRMAVKR